MIDKDFMGADFLWWVGVVEDRHDPLFLGRCRVRILGWHTKDKGRMPTASLPWATPLQPTTSAAQTQVGHTPLGLVEGSWVLGFFQDGDEAQYPIIMGSLGGYPSIKNDPYTGFNDPRPANEGPAWDYDETDNKPKRAEQADAIWPSPPYSVNINARNPTTGLIEYGPTIIEYGDNDTTQRPAYPRINNLGEPTTSRLARGKNDKSALILTDEDRVGTSIVQWKEDNRIQSVKKARPQVVLSPGISLEPPNWFEPTTPYNALYPYNHVYESESGHVTEIDDSPGAERLNWHHRSGTFTEIHPDGVKVNKITNNSYDIVYGHDHKLVRRSKYTNVDGSYQLYVNHADTSTGDYYLKVGSGANAITNVTKGDITHLASSGNVSTTTSNFVVNATEDITLNAKTINLNYQNLIKNVKGKEEEATEGSFVKSADMMTFAGDKEIQLTSKSISSTAAINSVEVLRPFSSLPLLNTDPDAKRITATLGKIRLNSLANVPTPIDGGGIILQHGLFGAGAELELGGLGDITISSRLGPLGNKFEALIGSQTFDTILGDEKHTIGSGNFDVKAALGDIKLTAVLGAIDISSQGGTVDVKTKTELNLEGTASANLKGAAIVLDGKTINLIKGSSEPVMLGSKFVKDFVKHQHATGTGPSGPVTDSSPYTNHLSKKVFSG